MVDFESLHWFPTLSGWLVGWLVGLIGLLGLLGWFGWIVGWAPG